MTTAKGILYIVATPIGHLGDITHRAIEILNEVQWIAAEDTRHTQKLLNQYNIQKKLRALPAFDESEKCLPMLEALDNGDSIALVSDAGTPLIQDPGQVLVSQAHQRGVRVVPIPGPSAITTALSAWPGPVTPLHFYGYLPTKSAARNHFLQEISGVSGKHVFFEAPHRIEVTLDSIVQVFGPDQTVHLAKEMTKQFEQFHVLSAVDAQAALAKGTIKALGEWVIGLPRFDVNPTAFELAQLMPVLLEALPVSKAASTAAKLTGLAKADCYAYALSCGEGKTR